MLERRKPLDLGAAPRAATHRPKSGRLEREQLTLPGASLAAPGGVQLASGSGEGGQPTTAMVALRESAQFAGPIA